ncbi:MAG: FHA domain-containing protein [Anaerolineales bacterium]|jgi:pSer/pThr/pTyr-binding forkhead associated (FHA) protein
MPEQISQIIIITGSAFIAMLIWAFSIAYVNLDSSRQTELYELEGELHINDLNSSHGTYVNGNRVNDKHLQSGDRVQIGSSALTILINGVNDAN